MSFWALGMTVFVALAAYWSTSGGESEDFCATKTWNEDSLSSQSKLGDLPLDCFFPSGYDEGREKFRKAVIQAGGELTSEPIGYGDLTIDFGLFRPSSSRNERVLLHVSGTHGVEAFAGSAIQLAILEEMKSNPLKKNDPTIVFVHALNPYGFRHWRRVNENNVDLNRNFLDLPGFQKALARDPNIAGYVNFDKFFNTPPPPTRYVHLNDVIFWAQNVFSLLKNGITNIKRAVVAGNYHDANKMSFGGFEKQPSIRILDEFLDKKNLQYPVNGLGFIDVHSGLGPSGIDTLMSGGSPDSLEPFKNSGNLKRIIEAFQSEEIADSGASSGYEFTIGTTSDFCANNFTVTDKKNRLCITEEFGTIPSIFVGQAQFQEMASWRYLKDLNENNGSEEEKEYARELMAIYSKRKLAAFLVDTKAWKHVVVHRGLTLFQDMRTHLMASPF